MAQTLPRAEKRSEAATALPGIGLTTLIIGLTAVLLVCVTLLHFTDPDYWWHLRTGKLIVDSGSVPVTDPFSFTAEGRHWVAHEWLAEVLIYVVQSVAGYGVLVLLFAGIALSALLVALRTAVSLGASRKAGAIVFFWAGLMSEPYWTVRPQVITWLLFAVFIAICVDHKQGGRRLWLLPPIMAVWANLHLGYAFGLAVIGLYLLSLLLDRYVRKQEVEIKPVLFVLGACIAATLLTPSTYETLLYPLQYLKPGNTNLSMITEWQSPDFHNPLFAPLALAVVSLAALGLFGPKRDLFLPMVAVLFGLLALQSARNQPLFAIAFLILAPVRLSEVFSWASPVAPQDLRIPRPALNAMLLIVLSVILFAWTANRPTAQLGHDAQENVERFPVAGVEYLQQYYPGARVFNIYEWGGYLIDKTYPHKVFIDGRSDFYGDTLMNDYLEVIDMKPGWQDVLRHDGVDVMLIKDESPLASRLDEEPAQWRRVYTGEIEAVFVRTDLPGPAESAP